MKSTEKVFVNKVCHCRGMGGPQGSGIFHIPSRCSDLIKGNTLYYHNRETGYPRQKSPRMTASFTTVRGFTLIELLVVVLIIGILAAVAVPQYQKAVMKSQYAKLKALAFTMAQAQEVYYLANGDYAVNIADLDIDMPGGKTEKSTDSWYYYEWGNCGISNGRYAQIDCFNSKINMGYQQRQNHAEVQANDRKCVARIDNDLGRQICKEETGDPEEKILSQFGSTSRTYQSH